MTPKQIERIKNKILNIRGFLADERRRFGGYFDNNGSRYSPPFLYIQIQDYKGGLTYMRWFHKNFSDDACFPQFYLRWTLILFKNGKLKDAEDKAIATHNSNAKIWNYFLKNITIDDTSQEWVDLQCKDIEYDCDDAEFLDFANWLRTFMETQKFKTGMKKE